MAKKPSSSTKSWHEYVPQNVETRQDTGEILRDYQQARHFDSLAENDSDRTAAEDSIQEVALYENQQVAMNDNFHSKPRNIDIVYFSSKKKLRTRKSFFHTVTFGLVLWVLLTWKKSPKVYDMITKQDKIRLREKFVKVYRKKQLRKKVTDKDQNSVRLLKRESYSSSLLDKAKEYELSELDQEDYEKYTIRINTYHRNELLLVSVNHHAKCEGVAQIQVIWCDSEQDPPEEVEHHSSGKVVIERHSENSLNARFDPLIQIPTRGVLSIDDDVLRPCMALDSGFFRWSHSPDRMVGFDPRVHLMDPETDIWTVGFGINSLILPILLQFSQFSHLRLLLNQYGAYSEAWHQENEYSMVLTRAAFLHRDYLYMYTKYLPREIYKEVENNFNCEDIAMSLFVSALTGGKPPLLADLWAIQAQLKLYVPPATKISNTSGHKVNRGECVDSYARLLEIHGGEGGLQRVTLRPNKMEIFRIGYTESPSKNKSRRKASREYISNREFALIETTASWLAHTYRGRLARYMYDMGEQAFDRGLIQFTVPWEERWNYQE